MSLETMTKILSTTVGSGGSASVTFENIPQNYSDLCIRISSRSSRSADEDGLGLKINDVTSGYIYRTLSGSGTEVVSINTAYEPTWAARIQGANAGANIFSNTEIYISGYASLIGKSYTSQSVTEKNDTTGYVTLVSLFSADTSPITKLTFSALNGTLQEHTVITLYGVKNAKASVANLTKASGGDSITTDGTYVYHKFNSTGTFYASSPLLIDYLVVAGGGGGSASGAGAGGLRTSLGPSGGGASRESSLSINAGTSLLCTVGAGGAAASNGQSGYGTNGSSSSIGSLVSTTGGGGGSYQLTNSTPGLSGGSGSGAITGGAANAGTNAGGAGTANEGYAGGHSGYHTLNASSTGGGGGAGGIGGSPATTDFGGVGGPGLAVNLHQGFTYFAGGGSGGYYVNGSSIPGGIGGGGAGSSNNSPGSPGHPNTGGGGGGSYSETYKTAAYQGGSGVIIIRYKV